MSSKNVPAVVGDEGQGNTPAPIVNEVDEWSDVDDGDLSPASVRGIPHIRLNRKVGIPTSGFLDPETGEVGTTMTAVLLAKSTSQAWWPVPFGHKDSVVIPDCFSGDGLAPSSRSKAKQSAACASCPKQRWDDPDPNYRRCSTAVELMVFVPDQIGYGRIARVRFGGLAIAPTEAYWAGFKNKVPRRPALSVLTLIELEPVETPNGYFLVPKFSAVRAFTRPEVEPLIAIQRERIEDWKAAVAADVAAGGSATEAGDPTNGAAPAGGSEPGTYVTSEEEEPF